MMKYVTATDKFLSGWDHIDGKISKIVVECETFKEAFHIEEKFKQRQDLKHVNIARKKPYYNPKRYHVTIKNKETDPAMFENIKGVNQ